MKNKLRQIIYDMRHQRVIAMVTLGGTALSVFLVMVVVMMQEVQTASFAPETRRERTVYGSGIHIKQGQSESSSDLNIDAAEVHIKQGQSESSSYLNIDAAEEIYSGLKGVERTAYYTPFAGRNLVGTPSGISLEALVRGVDSEFFRLYEFELQEGRYFSDSEWKSRAQRAILTESVADRLFGKGKAVGETVKIGLTDYEVTGVVKDVPALAPQTFAEIYTIIQPIKWGKENLAGNVRAVMLLEPGYPLERVRDEVKTRYAAIESRLSEDSVKIIYHGAPYDRQQMAGGHYGTNTDPSPDEGVMMRYLIYAILMLVPAINLSSMTHSRMRSRISEIGVRRAFGCTKARIIADIISENFIITLAGGLIGLLLSVVFASTYGDFASRIAPGYDTSAPLQSLLSLRIFALALAVCLILNIISASLPAWMASRVNPVDAINARNK